MNRTARLAKIEAAQKLCEWCEFHSQQEKAFRDSLLAQGVALRVPKLKDLKYGRCEDCGVPWTYDQAFLSLSDRKLDGELAEQQRATIKAGLDVPPEWYRQWLGLFDRGEAARREFYGAAYDVAIAATDFPRYRQFLEEHKDEALVEVSNEF